MISEFEVGAGGAIVYLSDKNEEFEEVLIKAASVMKKLEKCICFASINDYDSVL